MKTHTIRLIILIASIAVTVIGFQLYPCNAI